MQRHGLTWLFRVASEPGRLFGRYLKYNTLFLSYLFWDGLHGQAGGSARLAPSDRPRARRGKDRPGSNTYQ